jgi:hypothetical protein
MRSTWTDSRLDDFAEESGRRFDRLGQRMDAGFRDVRTEIGEVRTEIGEVRDSVLAVHRDISGLQRTLIQVAVAMFGTLFGMIVAITGVIATQL